MNGNDHEPVPTKVNRVINEVIRPYFKEEDWEDLESRLQSELDEIFSDAADLLGFMHLAAIANFIMTMFLIVLLFVWT